MFEDLKNFLDTKIEPAIESTGQFLRKLNGARTRLKNAIAKAEEQLKSLKDERKYVSDLKQDIREQAITSAKDELYATAVKAIQTNQEFDNKYYRKALFEAIDDDDTYIVRMAGSGFSSTIRVTIDLNRTAGRLNLWGAAVKAARQQLGLKVPRKNNKAFDKKAKGASRAWARIYNDGGKEYNLTIRTRLAAAGKVAPFWSILDDGTPPGLSSDRGGYPTPKNKVTNFESKAQVNVNARLAKVFIDLKKEYQAQFEGSFEELEIAKKDLDRLDDTAESIRLDIKANRELEAALGLDKIEIDRVKLDKSIDLVRKGLLTKGRVNIAPQGAKRKYVSILKIKENL